MEFVSCKNKEFIVVIWKSRSIIGGPFISYFPFLIKLSKSFLITVDDFVIKYISESQNKRR
jgi:hypothetical protein